VIGKTGKAQTEQRFPLCFPRTDFAAAAGCNYKTMKACPACPACIVRLETWLRSIR
jgi:hypothetical protein